LKKLAPTAIFQSPAAADAVVEIVAMEMNITKGTGHFRKAMVIP
jgi:hypothetical protein